MNIILAVPLLCLVVGAQAQTSHGSMGTHGPMEAGTHGPMGAATHGPMGAGTHGPMGASTHGPMGAGTHGPMGATTDLWKCCPEKVVKGKQHNCKVKFFHICH